MGLSWPSDDEVIIFNNIIIGFLFSLASVHKWVLVLLLKSAGFPIPAELSMCLFCVFFCCRGWFFLIVFVFPFGRPLLFWFWIWWLWIWERMSCLSKHSDSVRWGPPESDLYSSSSGPHHRWVGAVKMWHRWACENGRKCLPVKLVHVVGDVLFNGLV